MGSERKTFFSLKPKMNQRFVFKIQYAVEAFSILEGGKYSLKLLRNKMNQL